MKIKVRFREESSFPIKFNSVDTYTNSTSDYELLTNKPSINGVELVGNKTSEDLNIVVSYEGLSDKPSINGVELVGNKTSEDLDIAAKFPDDGRVGDVLMKTSLASDGVSWVTPASNAEEDNTRPITSAAVYTEIGNINALLATI